MTTSAIAKRSKADVVIGHYEVAYEIQMPGL